MSLRGRMSRVWREVEDRFSDVGEEARSTLKRARSELLKRVDESWDSPTELRQRALLSEKSARIEELESDVDRLSRQLVSKENEVTLLETRTSSQLAEAARELRYRSVFLLIVSGMGWGLFILAAAGFLPG